MNSPLFLVSRILAQQTRFARQFGLTAALALAVGVQLAPASSPPTVVRTVAMSGQPAPGTPSGVVFRDFNRFYFSLNDAGQVALLGFLTGGDVGGNNEGIWSEGSGSLSLVARQREFAPGSAKLLRFEYFLSPAINNSGQTSFAAGLTNFISAGYGIWSNRSESLARVVVNGDMAPGTTNDVTFVGFGGSLFNDAGQTAFRGGVAGEGVGVNNGEGIWSEGSGNLQLTARGGGQAAGMPDGIDFDVFGLPVLNDVGQTAFYAHVVGSDLHSGFGQGVWSDRSGSLAPVARSGTQAPGDPSGADFVGFSDPAINNNGQTAFWAYLDGTDPNAGEPHDDGIWSEGSGSLSMVARRGSRAPGTSDGITFGSEHRQSFDSPVLNDAGQIAFRGIIDGPGVDATNDEGIWSGADDSLALVARTGAHAPGTPSSVSFDTFFPWNGALQLNEAGQIAFTAFLIDEALAPFSGGHGIWATDRTGALQLIARTGDLLEVAPGDVRTISALSFLNEGTGNSDGRPSGLNRNGQIAFWARFNGGDEGIFVSNRVAVPEPTCTLLVFLGAIGVALRRYRWSQSLCGVCGALAIATTSQAVSYIVTDLGALGGTDSLGWGINSSGQVAGYAATTDDVTIKGFLWNPTSPNGVSGHMHDLGTLGGSFSWGTGNNDRGQVTGISATPEDAAEHATLWNPTTPNSVSGTLHDLGTLGGTFSQANSVNDTGLATGFSDLTGNLTSNAFLWKPSVPNGSNGTMHDLGSLGGTFTIGWDINASGQVVGDSDTADDAATRGFLWNPAVQNGTSGTMYDIGTLGGNGSYASGINDSGQVAGSSQVSESESYHAFLWSPVTVGAPSGTMQDLGTLGGLNSYSYAVNSSGQVVGLSEVPFEVSSYSHAFLYTVASGMLDLNTLIDPLSPWELLDADDINDMGQVTGQGLINGEYHAYLLTPIPLPGDFNNDGTVDAADYVAWRKTDSTQAGYATWQTNFARTLFAGTGASATGSTQPLSPAVPEPASLVLGLLAVVGASRSLERRTSF